ncbi:MAG: hypothetical protein Q9169_000975 [Polycauliona sp. 2 TL-2023]
MRSLMLILVCALSVSARCVKRQTTGGRTPVVQKSGATVQDGPGRKLLEESSAGPETPTDTTITSTNEDDPPSAQSSGSGDTTTSEGTSTVSDEDSDDEASNTEDTLPSGSGTPSVPGDESSTEETSSTSSDSGDAASDTDDDAATGSNDSDDDSSVTSNPSAGIGGNQTLSTETTPSTGGGGGSGSCGAMKNVCFNSGMKPDMFDLMTTASDWITFGLDIPGGSPSPRAKQAHIPMMAFAEHVAKAVELVSGPDAPEWMLTFNEPDFSYMGVTPMMDPAEAAEKIKPLLEAKKKGIKTKLVAPGLAFSEKPWLQGFFAACNCRDAFDAYNWHSYDNRAEQVITNIKAYHTLWPDKPMWITELAPQGCGKSPEVVGQFFKDVFQFAKGSGFVDKVFWNTGNQIDPKDTNVCDSWLVDGSGKPGPLLKIFEDMDCS